MTPRRRLTLLPLLLLVLGLAACGSEDKKLKVTGIEPERGDIEGGTYVRIKGNRFIADGARNAKVDVLIIFEPGGELKIPNGFTFVEKNATGPSVQDLDTSKVKKE
jgi:hypothetical protein